MTAPAPLAPPVSVTFTVIGTPTSQGSHRAFNGRVVEQMGERHRAWRDAVTYAAWEATRGQPPIEGAVGVTALIRLARPKKPARPYPTRPDSDKALRLLLDSMTNVVYRDDSQVVTATISKRYCRPGETPGADITVTDLAGAAIEEYIREQERLG